MRPRRSSTWPRRSSLPTVGWTISGSCPIQVPGSVTSNWRTRRSRALAAPPSGACRAAAGTEARQPFRSAAGRNGRHSCSVNGRVRSSRNREAGAICAWCSPCAGETGGPLGAGPPTVCPAWAMAVKLPGPLPWCCPEGDDRGWPIGHQFEDPHGRMGAGDRLSVGPAMLVVRGRNRAGPRRPALRGGRDVWCGFAGDG